MLCEFVPNDFYIPWTYINQNQQSKQLYQKVNNPAKLPSSYRYTNSYDCIYPKKLEQIIEPH